MRKLLTLFCTGIIGVLLFVSPGSTVKAAADEPCTCHDITFIVGAEKNKMVSDLLKSDLFKTAKQDLMQEGYKYHGVSNIEVIKFNVNNMIMIGVPFINNDGTVEMAGFMNGEYLGIAPDDEK